MAAAQHHQLQFEEEQGEKRCKHPCKQQYEPHGYLTEADDDVASPEMPSIKADTDAQSSGTESSCLCGAPEAPHPYELLNLRTSTGTYDTADFHGSGALHEQLPAGTIIDQCYKVNRLLGKGSFGACYAAEHLATGLKVVIKARVSTSGTAFSESLESELKAYMALNARGHQAGIPCLHSAGVHKLRPSTPSAKKAVCVSYLAIQQLGPSVWTCCHKKHGPQQLTWQPSRQDRLHIATGMLQALAAIHARGYIHKDVKTDNFCITGEHDNISSIYAIDYGFTRPAFGNYDYRKYHEWKASFWGTPNYASLNSLLRIPQGPRDDLEALVYCLLELEQESFYLPWNLTTNSEAAAGWSDKQLERMCRDKWAVWNHACVDGLVPAYLAAYFNYITELKPVHRPDYQYLLNLLQCGLTGHELPPKPSPRVYRAWPVADEQYDHQAVTALLLQELHAAASAVLPEAPAAAISAELQLQLDEQQDLPQDQHQWQQVAGKRLVRNPPAAQAAAAVDTGAFEGGAGWHGDEDEVDSAVVLQLQCCKRQRVAAAAAVGAAVFESNQTGVWLPGATAMEVVEGAQSQPEE